MKGNRHGPQGIQKEAIAKYLQNILLSEGTHELAVNHPSLSPALTDEDIGPDRVRRIWAWVGRFAHDVVGAMLAIKHGAYMVLEYLPLRRIRSGSAELPARNFRQRLMNPRRPLPYRPSNLPRPFHTPLLWKLTQKELRNSVPSVDNERTLPNFMYRQMHTFPSPRDVALLERSKPRQRQQIVRPLLIGMSSEERFLSRSTDDRHDYWPLPPSDLHCIRLVDEFDHLFCRTDVGLPIGAVQPHHIRDVRMLVPAAHLYCRDIDQDVTLLRFSRVPTSNFTFVV